MRSLHALLVAALPLFGLAAPAAAVPIAFNGTLEVVLGTFQPITVVAAGTANVTFSGGDITAIGLAGGTFATSVTIPVTDVAATPITQLSFRNLQNGPATFSTIPGGTINNNFVNNLSGTGSGTMALKGVANFGFFPGPLFNLSVPFTSGGVNGVGLGGAIIMAQGGGAGFSVRGAPWTTGTASIGTATVMGFVAGNTVQLVSPTFISATIGTLPGNPTFAVLTLTFAPEPGTLLLVALGVAGLALLGRRATHR